MWGARVQVREGSEVAAAHLARLHEQLDTVHARRIAAQPHRPQPRRVTLGTHVRPHAGAQAGVQLLLHRGRAQQHLQRLRACLQLDLHLELGLRTARSPSGGRRKRQRRRRPGRRRGVHRIVRLLRCLRVVRRQRLLRRV